MTMLKLHVGAALFGIGIWIVLFAPKFGKQTGIEGSLQHDLGVVRFDGAEIVVEYRFVLVNRYSADLQPDKLTLSCGCLDANCAMTSWASGEERQIKLRLTLRDFGRHAATAGLSFKNAEPISLTLSATGCPKQALHFGGGDLRIGVNNNVSFDVRLFTLDTIELPQTPLFKSVPACNIVFDGWQRELEAAPKSGTPGRFVGKVHVAVPSTSLQARVQIRVGEASLDRMLYR